MFSRDGSKVFVSTNAWVRIYDTQTGDSLGVVKGVGSFIAYSPDGRYIYTNVPYKIDAQTYEVVQSCDDEVFKRLFSGGGLATLTGDARFIVKSPYLMGAWSEKGRDSSIVIINTETFNIEKVLSYPGEIYTVRWIEASPDGKYFVTAEDDGNILTKEENRRHRLILWDAHTFDRLRVLEERQIADPDKPNYGTFTYFRFSPDSRMLGVIGGGKIEIFDMTNFLITKTIFGEIDNSPTVLTFSPNSSYLIWGQGGFTHASTRIAKTTTWEINYIYPSPYWAGGAIAISSDSKFIFAGNGYDLFMLHSKGDLTGIVEQNNANFFIKGQPNPSINELSISYSLPRFGFVKIYLTDMKGLEKINIYEGYKEQGLHNLKFPIQDLSSGVYFLTLELGNNRVDDKIIITK